MSKEIKKISRQNEQEYAHIYPTEQKQEYQYSDEDKRIKYHVDSDKDDIKSRDELYNIEPEQTVGVKPANKIKARLKQMDILEEHKERAYKVKNKPPIWDKTDPGEESYLLQEDPRDLEVKYIKETSQQFDEEINKERSKDISKPEERFTLSFENIEFKVGDRVQHNEEQIKGRVQFIGKEKIAVIWDDKTRERFSIDEAKKSLIILNTNNTQNVIENEVLNNIENNIEEEETIEKIKKKAALELIDLMRTKKLIPDTEESKEKQLKIIMAMDDDEFEEFKNKVIANKIDSTDLALMNLDYEDDFSDILDGGEQAKLKEKILKAADKHAKVVDGILMGDTSLFDSGILKASELTPTIGDFSSQKVSENISVNISSSNTKRSLAEIQRNKTNNQQETRNPNLDFSGFKNLTGLTKPITIPSKEITAGNKFTEIFSDPNFWTILGK